MPDVRTKGIRQNQEDVVGQGGTPVAVNESSFTPDEVILDPNGPLAVQIPEGVGADTSRNSLGLADTLAAGTPEAQFAAAENDDEEVDTDFSAGIVGPPMHSVPELARTHDATVDVADLSPGARKDEPAEDEPNPEDHPDQPDR